MKRLRLAAEVASIPAFHDFVRAEVEAVAPQADTGMLEMALEELLVNVASYAYPEGGGTMELCCAASEGGLDMALRDEGVAYDPTQTPDPDLDASLEDRAIGGLGVFLAGKVFSSMRYRREDGANVLELRYEPGSGVA